jgi:hypothetical protein
MKRKVEKLLISLVFVVCFSETHAQVTIGSDEKPGDGFLLQLKDKANVQDDALNASKGLGLPRVSLTNLNELYPMFSDSDTNYQGTNKDKMKKTHVGLMVYNVSTASSFEEGIYVWDGAKWVKPGGGTEPWRVSGTTDEATANTQNIYQRGQITIGSTAVADPTAALNVVATDKGVLFPRVALTSATDKETIKDPATGKPATGLLVYNLGTNPNFSTQGYLYWNGTEWKLFNSTSAEAGRAVLNCAGATMTPSQQLVGGTPIIGGTVLQIPYSGSNGGSFNGAVLTSINGNGNITATLSGGMLSVGSGVLNFALNGTPTVDQQAPNGITFDLTPFLDVNEDITGCDGGVVVGNILSASMEELAVMGFLTETVDEDGNRGYSLRCNSPDGIFSVRVWVPATYNNNTGDVTEGNGATPNVQIRNNTSSSKKIIWNFVTEYGGNINYNGWLTVPSKKWGGNNDGHSKTWYDRGYFGQPGIYDGDGDGPEYRRYTWISVGDNSKTAYEIKVMIAFDNPASNTSGHATQLKGYIKFEQVTAM